MSTDPTPTPSTPPYRMTSSLEEEEAIEAAASTSPLHMHVAAGAVLPGKLPPQLPVTNVSSRSSSRSRASLRSNSRSPSPQQQQGSVHPHHRSNLSTSSSTSLEFLDEDILTDKMGMLELEPQPCHSKPLLEQHQGKLPSVNERMSEESLDDVHAFSDLRNVIRQIKTTANITTSMSSNNSNEKESGNSGTISSTSSDGARSIGGSSYVDQGHLLETLLEFEEDDEEEDDDEEDEEEEMDTKDNTDDTLARKKLKKKLKDKQPSSHHDDKQEEE
jgi:hypothetical protein